MVLSLTTYLIGTDGTFYPQNLKLSPQTFSSVLYFLTRFPSTQPHRTHRREGEEVTSATSPCASEDDFNIKVVLLVQLARDQELLERLEKDGDLVAAYFPDFYARYALTGAERSRSMLKLKLTML